MLKYCIVTCQLLILTSCTVVKVVHVSQLNKASNYYWTYALPKNEFQITLTVEKIIYKKGPFAEFASSYLGIEKVPLQDTIRYKIKDISIHTSLIADSEQVFVIKYKRNFPWKSITQTLDGIIISLNEELETDTLSLPIFKNIQSSEFTWNYTEISKTPVVVDKIDTTYKLVKSDTLWVRIPVLYKTKDTLSLEEKAREAAKFLFDLRTRMYDLYTGDMESLPVGEAAVYIANELRRQEQEYLELFIGKTFYTTESYTFTIVPTATVDKPYSIAYFSESKGLSKVPTAEAEPIVMSILPTHTYLPLLHQLFKLEKAKEINAFYIRLPERAKVKIYYKDKLLVEQPCWFYQTGRIQKLPISFLKRKSFIIQSNTIQIK